MTDFSDWRDWMEISLGGFCAQPDRKREDMAAGALRHALRRPDIRADQIRMQQEVVDEWGLVGRPRLRRFFVDTLVEDEQITVFAIKNLCEGEDVDWLADKVMLVRAMNPDKKVAGLMIALFIEREVEALCVQHGITLIYRGYWDDQGDE
jgi:N-acetylglucosamine kinase-like BadF-type ATPase